MVWQIFRFWNVRMFLLFYSTFVFAIESMKNNYRNSAKFEVCKDLRIPIKMDINKCEGGWEANRVLYNE